MRICNICKNEFPITNFYRDKSQSTGYMHRCKECDKKKSAKWQRESGYDKSQKRSHTNPHRKAKGVVRHAVKTGKLPPIKTRVCVICHNVAEEYHHWSYEEKHFLDVIPLCKKCHHKIHNNQLSLLIHNKQLTRFYNLV